MHSFGGKGWFLLPYLLCCTFKSTGFHKHFHTPTLRLLLSPKIFYKSKENYIFTRRKDCSFWDQILETADVLQTMLKIFIVSTIIHFFYKIFSIGVMLYFGRHFLTIPYLLFFLKRSIWKFTVIGRVSSIKKNALCFILQHDWKPPLNNEPRNKKFKKWL